MALRGAGFLLRAIVAAACAAAALPRASAAQADTTAGGLTLEQALRSALERAVDVRLARERLLASRGTARSARGAFDTQITSFVGSSREHTLRFDGQGAPVVEPSRTTGLTYGVAVDRRFRNGVVVSPQVGAKRVLTSPRVEQRNNTASVDLVVQVPLLRGAGFANVAGERAALVDVRAATEELRFAGSAGVLDAAVAYWGYVASGERLDAYRQAEERARRLVEQTRALIAAQERPAADINPLLANLASREAARIAAEQDLVAAREQVGLAMGLAGAEVSSLPPAAATLPAPDSVALPEPGTLIRDALEARADLRAARYGLESAQLLSREAATALRPRLDVQVNVGYTGAEPGDQLSQLVTPFGSMAGWSAAVEVTSQLYGANATARGEAELRRALRRQREIELADVERTIRSGVTVAAEALRRGREELARSEEAVRLHSTVVENEERKFALGMSTLFDVLQAEQSLTDALLQRIAARERYAVARARLAFETGALVREDGETARVDLRTLVPGP